MMGKYNLFTALFLYLAIIAGTKALAEEKTKEYHESWPENSLKTLQINNKFGEVKITDKGGDNVTIDEKKNIPPGSVYSEVAEYL